MRTVFAFLLLAATAQAGVNDSYPGTLAGDESMRLPADENGWFLSVFTSANPTPEELQFLAWFDRDPRLASLKQQTHFNYYTPKSTLWTRYVNGTVDIDGRQIPPLISSVPAVAVHRPTGPNTFKRVAKFEAPSEYFRDSKTLASAIAACIRAETKEVGGKGHIFARPWRPDCDTCPQPQPQPQPYTPDFGPKPLVPDIEPPETIEEAEEEGREEEVADETHFMLVLACIAAPTFFVLGIAGLVIGWHVYKPKHHFYKKHR
ncbi:MAG: hypothetical protein KGL39_34795 [Patescibacteria group bacterium]|nr:hypothetical protein [Patescibacteria group bacterium]